MGDIDRSLDDVNHKNSALNFSSMGNVTDGNRSDLLSQGAGSTDLTLFGFLELVERSVAQGEARDLVLSCLVDTVSSAFAGLSVAPLAQHAELLQYDECDFPTSYVSSVVRDAFAERLYRPHFHLSLDSSRLSLHAELPFFQSFAQYAESVRPHLVRLSGLVRLRFARALDQLTHFPRADDPMFESEREERIVEKLRELLLVEQFPELLENLCKQLKDLMLLAYRFARESRLSDAQRARMITLTAHLLLPAEIIESLYLGVLIFRFVSHESIENANDNPDSRCLLSLVCLIARLRQYLCNEPMTKGTPSPSYFRTLSNAPYR